MLHEVARRLREQYLPSVPGTHDPCCIVDIQAHITFGRKVWLSRMQPHPYFHRYAFEPRMCGEGGLYSRSSRHSISGTGKGHEEGIALGIDLVALVGEEHRAEKGAALLQRSEERRV